MHKGIPNTECQVCHKPIYRRPLQIQKAIYISCSKVCQTIAIKQHPEIYAKISTNNSGKNNAFYGKKHDRETRLKMSKNYTYHAPWNKGLTTLTSDRVKENALHKMGVKRPDVSGANNHFWKGDNVGYTALHDWVRSRLGKASRCSNNSGHISKVYCWANISGEYKRDLSDWRELCTKCNLSDGIRVHKRFKEGGYLYA